MFESCGKHWTSFLLINGLPVTTSKRLTERATNFVGHVLSSVFYFPVLDLFQPITVCVFEKKIISFVCCSSVDSSEFQYIGNISDSDIAFEDMNSSLRCGRKYVQGSNYTSPYDIEQNPYHKARHWRPQNEKTNSLFIWKTIDDKRQVRRPCERANLLLT